MPRIFFLDVHLRGGVPHASMRPGHFAPDISAGSATCTTSPRCFNEAGAFCPGYCRGRGWAAPGHTAASMRPGHFAPDIRPRHQLVARHSGCFNEAGAFCPGYFRRPGAGARAARLASMRPGHFAPDIYPAAVQARRAGEGASMRPGHFAPDISSARRATARQRSRFNEAGAFCPGY